MARTLTINTIKANSDGTTNVNFTMSGLAISAMNQTYSINNLPVGTKYDLFVAIKAYLQAHAQGLQSVAPTVGPAVTAVVASPVDLDGAITQGT